MTGADPIADHATLAAANARSQAAARRWQDSAAYRDLKARFDLPASASVGLIVRQAHAALEDAHWVEALLAPLVADLRADRWFEPPLRIARDALRIGAILFECPAVSITASVLSADVLAALPLPRTLVVPGRLSVVRYVRGGGARLRLWHAEPCTADFAAQKAKPCSPLGLLPLGDGVVLRLDGRRRGWLIENARSDVVTLTATIRTGAAPLMREYAIDSGAFVRSATLDDRASRTQMLLTLLRLSGRADAGAAFETATRDGAFFLRWAAMREWLALDARAALPRLREMAAEDTNGEVRAAAATTLTLVETRMAARRCPA